MPRNFNDPISFPPKYFVPIQAKMLVSSKKVRFQDFATAKIVYCLESERDAPSSDGISSLMTTTGEKVTATNKLSYI